MNLVQKLETEKYILKNREWSKWTSYWHFWKCLAETELLPLKMKALILHVHLI